jgi:hypothetical protein
VITSETTAPPISLRLPSPRGKMPPVKASSVILGALGTKSLVALRNEETVRVGEVTAARREVAATTSPVHGQPPRAHRLTGIGAVRAACPAEVMKYTGRP